MIEHLKKQKETGAQFNFAVMTSEYRNAASIYNHIKDFVDPVQDELLKARLTELEEALMRETLCVFGMFCKKGHLIDVPMHPMHPDLQIKLNEAYRMGLRNEFGAELPLTSTLAYCRSLAPETFADSDAPILSVRPVLMQLLKDVPEMTDEQIKEEFIPEIHSIVECVLAAPKYWAVFQARANKLAPRTRAAIAHLVEGVNETHH